MILHLNFSLDMTMKSNKSVSQSRSQLGDTYVISKATQEGDLKKNIIVIYKGLSNSCNQPKCVWYDCNYCEHKAKKDIHLTALI